MGISADVLRVAAAAQHDTGLVDEEVWLAQVITALLHFFLKSKEMRNTVVDKKNDYFIIPYYVSTGFSAKDKYNSTGKM